MPKGYKADGSFAGKVFKKGHKPTHGFPKGHKPTHGFKKGIIPITAFPKGHIPWSKGKKLPKLSLSRMGAGNPSWQNGVTFSRGYKYLLRKNHPFATYHGYVREHRLVVEKHLGRYLTPKEKVHHVNKNKKDNRVQNLMAFIDNEAHRRFENGKKVKLSEIIFDGRKLK